MLSLVAIRNHVPLVQKYRHEFDVRFSARRSLLSCFRVVNALFYSRLSSTSTLPILKRLHGGGVAKNKTPPSCAAVSVCLSPPQTLRHWTQLPDNSRETCPHSKAMSLPNLNITTVWPPTHRKQLGRSQEVLLCTRLGWLRRDDNAAGVEETSFLCTYQAALHFRLLRCVAPRWNTPQQVLLFNWTSNIHDEPN